MFETVIELRFHISDDVLLRELQDHLVESIKAFGDQHSYNATAYVQTDCNFIRVTINDEAE